MPNANRGTYIIIMIVLVSYSIATKTYCSLFFSDGASLHQRLMLRVILWAHNPFLRMGKPTRCADDIRNTMQRSWIFVIYVDFNSRMGE